MEELAKYMKALLLLQLHMGKDGPTIKAEVLLAKAGFAHTEIAELLGKNADAVSKTIRRAK